MALYCKAKDVGCFGAVVPPLRKVRKYLGQKRATILPPIVAPHLSPLQKAEKNPNQNPCHLFSLEEGVLSLEVCSINSRAAPFDKLLYVYVYRARWLLGKPAPCAAAMSAAWYLDVSCD